MKGLERCGLLVKGVGALWFVGEGGWSRGRKVEVRSVVVCW